MLAALLCFTVIGADAPPNIVLLVADDLGYGEIAPGADAAQIPTPHIDAIDDVVFTAGYVAGPNCSPSRAGLLSGLFPTRFGYEFNPIGPRNEEPGVGLPPSIRTLPERLRDAGYATGLIGKWHLGGSAPYHPHRQGFDRFFGFLHEGHYFRPAPYDGLTTWLRKPSLPPLGEAADGRWVRSDERLVWSSWSGRNEPDYDANNPILRDGQPVAEPDYLTDAFTREAVAFVRSHAEQPFFLEVAYSAVHSPLQAKNGDVDAFAEIGDIQRRIFAGMLKSLDESVGAILVAIEAAGVGDRTIVVFLSDNGGPTRELTSSNRPLRGEKSQMYEGGVRVPLRMELPAAMQPPAATVEDPVSTLDLTPTLLGLAGGRVDGPTDGLDIAGLLDGSPADADAVRGKLDERPLFFRQGSRAALRWGGLKIVRDSGWNRPPGRWELYDVAADPSESNDLIEARPDDAARLIRRFESLDAEMSDPLF